MRQARAKLANASIENIHFGTYNAEGPDHHPSQKTSIISSLNEIPIAFTGEKCLIVKHKRKMRSLTGLQSIIRYLRKKKLMEAHLKGYPLGIRAEHKTHAREVQFASTQSDPSDP